MLLRLFPSLPSNQTLPCCPAAILLCFLLLLSRSHRVHLSILLFVSVPSLFSSQAVGQPLQPLSFPSLVSARTAAVSRLFRPSSLSSPYDSDCSTIDRLLSLFLVLSLNYQKGGSTNTYPVRFFPPSNLGNLSPDQIRGIFSYSPSRSDSPLFWSFCISIRVLFSPPFLLPLP